MNNLFSMLGGLSGGSGTSVLLQAVGAALRGESAQTFMRRLANQHPAMKKVNFDDLMGSAEALAKENNMDIEQLKSKLDDVVSPMLPK